MRPTFINLIHNMTLLHHLSSQRFSGPEALVSEVTDGGWVCVFMHVCVHTVCVRAGRAVQVVFELMADCSKFARPYAWIHSSIHHLSQYNANLALLSLWTFSVFPSCPNACFGAADCCYIHYNLQDKQSRSGSPEGVCVCVMWREGIGNWSQQLYGSSWA